MLDLRRREFVALLGSVAAAWPLAARAQQPERMRRIAVFSNRSADDPEWQARMAAFHQGLQELGWTVGRNIRIEHASVSGTTNSCADAR
jgi:putative tryptophan/tyrosine transport system substrate-binding protein